jgi:predicted RNase H-like HicB family nuclease
MTHLQKYIQAALKKAQYEFDEDTASYVGYVEELPVCWAQGDSIEEARAELESIIEGWILLSIRRGERLPSLGGVNFSVPSLQPDMQYA